MFSVGVLPLQDEDSDQSDAESDASGNSSKVGDAPRPHAERSQLDSPDEQELSQDTDQENAEPNRRRLPDRNPRKPKPTTDGSLRGKAAVATRTRTRASAAPQ